jgi:hypothetical protein
MPRPWRTAAAACGVTAMLVLLACRDLDVVTESYATLDEAIAAGAVERGWLPAGLPAGVFEIREAHDLDSARRWGVFNFPPGDNAGLRALFDREISVQGVVCHPPARIEWWPVLLRGPLDDAKVRATSLTAYAARQGELIFLVNWKQGRGYYCSR